MAIQGQSATTWCWCILAYYSLLQQCNSGSGQADATTSRLAGFLSWGQSTLKHDDTAAVLPHRPGLSSAHPPNTVAMRNLTDFVQWNTLTPPSGLLQSTYMEEALALLSTRRATLRALTTLDDWKNRQRQVREALAVAMAPIELPRTPLNARITSKHILQDSGVAIENVIFESRPGFRVTGSWFLPSTSLDSAGNVVRSLPAVLFANGHWCLDHRAITPPPGYPLMAGGQQRVVLNIVKLGIAVFAFDPPGQGERTQYWDEHRNVSAIGGCVYDPNTCVASGIVHQDEEFAGRQLDLTNVTAASVWLWDAKRALDHMLSRPFVNGTRVGVAGCSGGGTQAAFLAATDRRIGPAAIACYMSTLKQDLRLMGPTGGQYADWRGGFKLGLDKSDLVEVRSPAPTLIMSTTDDPAFPVSGSRAVESEAKRVFELYGNASNLQRSEAVFSHGWVRKNNEAMYAFFRQHLHLPQSTNTTEDPDIPPVHCSHLTATNTGQLASDKLPDAKFLPDIVRETAIAQERARTITKVIPKNKAAFMARLPRLAAEVVGMPSNVTYYGDNDDDDPMLLGTSADGTAEAWALQSEGRCMLSVRLYFPADLPQLKSVPVVVILTACEASVTDFSAFRGSLESNAGSSMATAVVNLCGMGDFGVHNSYGFKGDPFAPERGNSMLAMGLNRSTVGIHAYEILLLLRSLALMPKIRSVAAVVATNYTGSAALHAALFAHESDAGRLISKLLVVSDITSYTSIATSRFYAMPTWMAVSNILSSYDLPDILASLASAKYFNKLLVLGPISAMQTPLNTSAALEAFAVPERAFAASGHPPGDFMVRPGVVSSEASLGSIVVSWLLHGKVPHDI